PRCCSPQGRADAEICRVDLLRLLVLARARDVAGGDRQEPGIRQWPDTAQTLQGQRRRGRAREQIFAVRSGPGDVRGRQGRLRSARRRRVYPAERATAAHAGAKEAEAEAKVVKARCYAG